MRCTSSSILSALAATVVVSARPIRTRAVSAIDGVVFQFANILYQLEAEFYTQAIAKFTDSDFAAAGFSSSMIATQQLTNILANEKDHITLIRKTLSEARATPAYLQLQTRILEFVGVSAFLDAAPLVDDKKILDAAGTILTTEARHQTVLNILSQSGSSIPQAFDIPDPARKSSPSPAASLTALATLGSPGTLLTFSGTNVTSTDGLFCNMITGGVTFALNLPLAECVPLLNNAVNRVTTQQVAGATIAFVDTVPEILVQMVRKTV
ncbi:ferritin-like domain-containing protein [Mycena vulgaris]|nr:ferritin-like domain-containing protein [Mycena vulgaris]